MQRVGLERLARGFGRRPRQHAGAEEIDDDRDRDHREARDRRLHRGAVGAQQPLHGFPDHARGEQEQERGLGQRRDALDLAVPVLVLAVGRLAGDAHREISDHGGGEIEQRMRGFRENGERAGQQPDHGFGQCESGGGRDRAERHAFLVVRHRGLPRDRYRRGGGA